MTYNHFRIINKGNLDKLKDLFYSLRIIKDGLDLLNQEKLYQMSVIHGQLRALLTDTSNKKLPLLFDLATVFSEDIELYYIPFDLENEKLNGFIDPGDEFPFFYPQNISIIKTHERHIKISLKDYLTLKTMSFKGQKFDLKELITLLANNFGGAHYSARLPQYMADIFFIQINGLYTIDHLMVKIARIVLEIGINFLAKATDFELFCTLSLTKPLDKKDFFLMDHTLPNSSSRFSLIINGKILYILLIDVLNYKILIPIKTTIRFNKPYLINFSTRLRKDLTTEIEIYYNKKLVERYLSKVPLLFINQFEYYNLLINKSIEQKEQNYEFALGQYLMYPKAFSFEERKSTNQWFDENPETQYSWYNKQSYGYKESGQKNIINSGTVSLIPISQIHISNPISNFFNRLKTRR